MSQEKIKYSPMQIVAILASKVDLSTIPEGQVATITLPATKKYSGDRQPATDAEFSELIEEWNGKLTDIDDQEEGDFGIDSKGILHVLTKDGWHLLSEFGGLKICTTCYSDSVYDLMWVNGNTGQVSSKLTPPEQTPWCDYCGEFRDTIYLTDLHKQGGQHGNDTDSEVPKNSA